MPTPEGLIKQAICYYLLTRKDLVRIFWSNASVGIYDPVRKMYRKNNSPFQLKGTSDILGMFHGGRMFALEVKAGKNKPTAEQKIFLDEINQGGGLGIVAYSVDEVKAAFAKIAQMPIDLKPEGT